MSVTEEQDDLPAEPPESSTSRGTAITWTFELVGPPRPAPTALMVLEAAVLCVEHPLTLAHLDTLFAGELSKRELKALVEELREDWKTRGLAVELVETANGWHARGMAELLPEISRAREDGHGPKYSKAVLETLAVIAYRQPVTRRIIEEQRGVSVSPAVLQQLEARGWIEVIGHQESPGTPALYATTFKFLDDLQLATLADLPLLPGETALFLSDEPVDGDPAAGMDAYEPYEGAVDGQAWSPDQYAPAVPRPVLADTLLPPTTSKTVDHPTDFRPPVPPASRPVHLPNTSGTGPAGPASGVPSITFEAIPDMPELAPLPTLEELMQLPLEEEDVGGALPGKKNRPV